MALVEKNDIKQIFADQAPSIDKPATFANYPRGWDVARPNNGKPTIKQFNYLQQRTDQNILWIHQNGAALPYDATMEYAEGAVVVKDGKLQKKSGSNWNSVGGNGIIAVDSIADLIALRTPKNGNTCIVGGVQGGGDRFVYESNKSSVNDGGTIFNGWVRQDIQSVKPEWFGAIPNGIFDCADAIQKAVNYCKSKNIARNYTIGGGYPPLEFSNGIYLVSTTLNMSGFTGWRVFGHGWHTSVILFGGKNSSLFNWSTYIDNELSDLSILNAVLDTSTTPSGYKFEENTGDGSRTNICFDFNTTSSGSMFTQNRLLIVGFKDIYNSTKSVVNGDNMIANQCVYLYFDALWRNTNPNSVIWTFNECKTYYGTDCFINAGNTLVVNGGDWINKGTFFTGNLTNRASESVFNAIRFENYQNIEPTSEPKLLNISGNHALTFNNCTSRGGGSLIGKTTALLSGSYTLKIYRCSLQGNWEATVNTAVGGVTSSIVFEECEGVPTVNQTLYPSVGNVPLNISYRNHKLTTSSSVNRTYFGLVSGNANTSSIAKMTDVFYMESVISTTPVGRNIPVFTVAPYLLQVSELDISFKSNAADVVTLTLYTDSTKSVKLAEVKTSAVAGISQLFNVKVSEFLARYNITASANNLYFEAVATSNAGLSRVYIKPTYTQVS